MLNTIVDCHINDSITDSCLQIEELGGSAIVVGGDMSKEADVEAVFKAVSTAVIIFLLPAPRLWTFSCEFRKVFADGHEHCLIVPAVLSRAGSGQVGHS